MTQVVISKDEVIRQFKVERERFMRAISGLTPEQMTTIPVLEDWTVRDIIAHLAGWSWQAINAIDQVLRGEFPSAFDGSSETEARLNEAAVTERRRWPLEQVIKEWEESFAAEVGKLEHLTDSQWRTEAPFVWGNDRKKVKVSVWGLYNYSYNGEHHEGGHAKQIENFFKTKTKHEDYPSESSAPRKEA